MVRQTSINAYKSIQASGALSKRRWEVYQILFNSGPLTARQVYELVPGARYKSHTAGRLTELTQMGVIYEVSDKAICPITQHTVILYDVTDKLPVKIEKKKSKTKIIEELREEIVQLKLKLGEK